MDDDVEFATDMEEPVCEGSEEHNHQQERHPHGITVYLGFLRIVARDNCRLDNSLKLVLDAVSNTEQLWRSFISSVPLRPRNYACRVIYV